MKNTIILSILAALPMLAQCPCGGQQCAPQAPACQCAHRHMNHQAMEAMKAKFMEKFDTNKDGQLSDEEKAEAKKFFEAKHAERKAKFMEKFDTDKDGQLSDEEKAEVKKFFEAKKAEWQAKMAQRKPAGKPCCGPRHHGKPGCGHRHHGMRHGKPGCGHPQLTNEQKEAMKAKFMEKFDTNKDGQLSDEEKAEVKKFFEAKKAEWMAKKGQCKPGCGPRRHHGKPCCGPRHHGKPGCGHHHHGMRHGKPGCGHGMKPCCKPAPQAAPAPAPQAAPAPAPAPAPQAAPAPEQPAA